MDSDRIVPKISLPVQAGSLGSRAALELVRNSRLRSSCPPSTPSPTLTAAESTAKPLTVASFMAMRNGNRSPKPRRSAGSSPQPGIKHKKAVIPITSKQTSRVLNNLNVDCVVADVQIENECHSLQNPLIATSEGHHYIHHDLDNASTDSGSLDHVIEQNRPYRQWERSEKSNRHSVSSFGSSEEDIWIPQRKS